MIIGVTSVLVDNQDKALQFYTEVLGFLPKRDVPTGNPNGDRWLTVVSPERPEGVELLLEPSSNAIASDFQRAIKEQGIPATQFTVADVAAEVERLQALGVQVTMPATDIGPAIIATFDDSCGNFIQIVQMKGG